MSADNGPKPGFTRRGLLAVTAGVATALWAAEEDGMARDGVDTFELDEITIEELQRGMASGKYSAHSLARKYLDRIEDIDRHGPRLRSVIEVNPDALTIATALDRERTTKGPRGPLHGIPVLIKDNIDTGDRMATTAGSLALVGARPPGDAFLVTRLRRAGAVILGKTNLSEWANFRSTRSTSAWSGRGGLTRNPYALDRNPSGSSSGSAAAVAASLCAAAVGTETDGSIVSPASACGIVGVKPTVGLISRAGVIPISSTQDTAGPMARTVRDAALLLGALAGSDPGDPVTAEGQGRGAPDYTVFLDPAGLDGARLGVARRYFGFLPAVDALMAEALSLMKSQGAVLIDPVELETVGKFDDSESIALRTEFKAGLNAYLARLEPGAPVRSLADVIAFNEQHREREMPYFGQEQLLRSEAMGPLTGQEYRDAVAKNRLLARAQGIDAVMEKHGLDALVAPTRGPAALTDLVNGDYGRGGCSSLAAVAGYPHVTLPVGSIRGLPVGLSFFGRAWSEPTLLRLAFAYEQATQHRQPPRFLPTVEL